MDFFSGSQGFINWLLGCVHSAKITIQGQSKWLRDFIFYSCISLVMLYISIEPWIRWPTLEPTWPVALNPWNDFKNHAISYITVTYHLIIQSNLKTSYKSLNTQNMKNSNLVYVPKMEYVHKFNSFGLKMMVKSGLEKIILKFLHAEAIFY